MFKRIIIPVFLCSLSQLFAAVILPAVLSQDRVLQRDQGVPCWGGGTRGGT